MRKLKSILTAIIACALLFAGNAPTEPPLRAPVSAPAIREYPILTPRRLELLQAYMRRHYGTDSTALVNPALIVVHYTAIAGLPDTLATFKLEKLPAGRTDIAGHGDVNVSVHYVIARDGTIYRLQPEEVVARHVIGLNWCSLGIELVAANEKQLTDAQTAFCAQLVAWIASRYPSVEYLIGHQEYARKDLPHHALYRELDLTYTLTKKIDPGVTFMRRLRSTLASQYSLSLKD
jgi:N-acetyl-anhydromuramyl-L-alanine amidase AmpD